jgi:hypothetical protein
MYCPKCGKESYEQVRFCKTCGTDLGPVHLAIEGRLPDLTTIMTEEKRRQMMHRGVMGTATGVVLLLLLKIVALASLFVLGKPVDSWIMLLMVLLSAPFLAYGIGSLISGMFVYKRKNLDYANRFDVVREMLDAQRVMELPSANSFPRSITEHTTSELEERIPRQPERGAN